MDPRFHEALRAGLETFGLALPAGAEALLERYADRLLAWNRKVNLTSITDPAEVAEKHLVDSLLVLPVIAGARSLLDVGAGAGHPASRSPARARTSRSPAATRWRRRSRS